jgi:hypothetical protein
MTGTIVVGMSSWADPGFVEEWYPPGLPARDRLVAAERMRELLGRRRSPERAIA